MESPKALGEEVDLCPVFQNFPCSFKLLPSNESKGKSDEQRNQTLPIEILTTRNRYLLILWFFVFCVRMFLFLCCLFVCLFLFFKLMLNCVFLTLRARRSAPGSSARLGPAARQRGAAGAVSCCPLPATSRPERSRRVRPWGAAWRLS